MAEPARPRPEEGALNAPLCPLCGQPNGCAAAATGRLDAPCWCRDARFGAELLARVPAELQRRACICPACAAGR